MGTFKYLSHTADMGFVARGKTLNEAFEEAAKALFAFLIDLKKVKPVDKVKLSLKGHDYESLFFNWLNELLYQSEHRQMLFSQFKVESMSQNQLKAIAWGEKIDPERHQINNQVKACTYHLLKVEKENEGFMVQAVCDV